MLQPNDQVLCSTNIASNMHSLNVDVIAEIQKELDISDTISMVFLLYDSPDTALQQLIVFERVSKDVDVSNCTLLRDWTLHAQARPTWRYEFLEALAICQLYSVIRKLGFQVSSIKRHFLPENMHVSIYINTMKKALYKICENITMINLIKLKNAIKTYNIDTTDYEACELVFLKLTCERFITIQNSLEKHNLDSAHNIENLAKIIENLTGLKRFAIELRDIERLNITQSHTQNKTSTPEKVVTNDSKYETFKDIGITNDEICKILDESLFGDDNNISFNLESDTKKCHDNDVYEIKNPKRIGVCYIINQDTFHPSKESIEGNFGGASEPLENRLGSTKDRKELEKTMTALNFEVICHSNLDHKKMFSQIRDIVKFRVQHDDSIFILCILSHGVRGHVFAADSVKVSVDSIQNFLDSEAIRLQGIPKIMVIQACQVEVEPTQSRLVADSPADYRVTKTDFLIYWATAPQLQAFRDQKNGSIFVQILCRILNKFADIEHVFDLFTRVNFMVNKICEALECNQAPIFESTLLKKIYLHVQK